MRYRCYGRDDFGHPYDALSTEDLDGDWVRFEDHAAELDIEKRIHAKASQDHAVAMAALEEAARMMLAVKRTWGPESHDDGADGELWAWLNDFVTRYSTAQRGSQHE